MPRFRWFRRRKWSVEVLVGGSSGGGGRSRRFWFCACCEGDGGHHAGLEGGPLGQYVCPPGNSIASGNVALGGNNVIHVHPAGGTAGIGSPPLLPLPTGGMIASHNTAGESNSIAVGTPVSSAASVAR